MLNNTKGIVLKTIKYGGTSVIVSIFTELFGIQSYLVNGIRIPGKSSSGASYFQSASILDLVVYHNELKNLQRIKEFRWNYIYKNVFNDVIKNAVAMYMVELLLKCLKQPEHNVDLFHFSEDAFTELDVANQAATANFPIYFCLQVAQFFGFKIQDEYSEKKIVLDLQEGTFIDHVPHHSFILENDYSYYTSQLLKVQHPKELSEIRLNNIIRNKILMALQSFYTLHIQDFGTMKTLPILHQIFA